MIIGSSSFNPLARFNRKAARLFPAAGAPEVSGFQYSTGATRHRLRAVLRIVRGRGNADPENDSCTPRPRNLSDEWNCSGV